MRWPKEAEILQAAAVAVAAPRYMGAFAAAIGINLIQNWLWFATVEIITGGAMALLEGWAVAFLFRHWRRLRFRSTHWYVLLGLQIALLLMLPATATPYLVASQRNETITVLLDPAAQWLWSLGLATIAPLIAAAIGYADAGSGTVAKVSEGQRNSSQSQPEVSEVLSFVCSTCLAEFGSQSALNAHRRQHSVRPKNVPAKSWQKFVLAARNANNKARQLNILGEITPLDWLEVLQFYAPDGKCLACGQVKPLALDHVNPLKWRGENVISNTQPLCDVCNSSKTDAHDYRPDGGEFALKVHQRAHRRG